MSPLALAAEMPADGNEPSLQAWQAELQSEGVPFYTLVALDAPPLTAAQLKDADGRPRYQAVVLATSGLGYFDDTQYVSAFAPEE